METWTRRRGQEDVEKTGLEQTTHRSAISWLDARWSKARRSPFLWRFTLFVRLLLVASFLPTGLVKALGLRFTSISVESPIGAFFEAMYQTGEYWRFIGCAQILAALLLLVPPLAHWGAAMFLTILTNIFVITVALEFTGTPVVVGLMLLAVIYLCVWDYHRFRSLFTLRPWPVPSHPRPSYPRVARLDGYERAGFAVVGACVLLVFLAQRGQAPVTVVGTAVAVGLVAGLATFGRYVLKTLPTLRGRRSRNA